MKVKHQEIEAKIAELIKKDSNIASQEIYDIMKMGKYLSYEHFRKIVSKVRKDQNVVHYKSSRLGAVTLEESVLEDIEKMHQKTEKITEKNKNKHLMSELDVLKKEVEAALKLKTSPQSYRIETKRGKEKSYSTAIVLASDWHIEEEVKPQMVNGLNHYTLDIAAQRIKSFARNTARLWQINNQDTRIQDMVLMLGGDFITGNIHQDNIESCRLRPLEAIWEAQKHIMSVIEHLLGATDCNFIIPCHMGNHSRITKKTHWGNQSGNSLEWLMYKNLERIYTDNKRVKFMVAEGYHTFIDVDGFRVRTHHGDAIRYAGGVGGLFIPAYKAISQWNKSKAVDLDCFGHLHQFVDGGNFVCNGSLIGYNSYAVAGKFGFEKPYQSYMNINHKYKEKTNVCKIFLE